MKHSLLQSDKSQKGFSLIEVMVAMGVAAVLTYAISQMLVNSGKQAASVQSKGDFNSFTNQLQGAFNNTGTCIASITPTIGQPWVKTGLDGKQHLYLPLSAAAPNDKFWPIKAAVTLGNTVYSATPASGITTTFGGPPTTPGGPVSKKALTIKNFNFTTISQAASSNPNQYVVPVHMEVDRSVNGETAVAGNTLTKDYSLILTVNPNDVFDPNPAATPKRVAVTGCAAQYADYWVGTGDNDILYSGGNVGIGVCDTVANPTCVDPPLAGAALDVQGSTQATAFMYRSDARLKENVRDIPSALDRVLKLHGVLFDWKSKADRVANRDQLGFIAQEVEKVFPEAVNTAPGNGLKTVGYGNLLAPVIEAFKQQKDILERQQKEIEELKKEVLQRKGNGT